MDILTKKVFGRTSVPWALCLLICALCLIPGHSLIVSAQDTDVRVTSRSNVVNVEVDEGEVADDDIFIMEEEIIFIDDFDMEDESAETGEVDADAETPGDRKRRPTRGERPERSSEDAFPPESLEIMEKEGISPEDLKDPEIAKKLREKVEQRRREEGKDGSQPEKKALTGLRRYTSIIVKKNLFLRLGSGGEKRGPEYALTAVLLSNNPEETENRAIIERKGGGESYYVVEGDTFAGGLEVVDIEDEAVKLDKSGEEITLSLGEGTSGGGGGGRRGGRSSGGGEEPPSGGGGNESRGGRSRRGGGGFDANNLPPRAREWMEEHGISMEEVMNDPEARQRAFRQFRQSMGGGDRMGRMMRGRGRDGGDRRRR